MRFDIAWRDLATAVAYCLWPGRRSDALAAARDAWAGANDTLITLSVRSSFDLLLRALALPRGSEILFSALTVPDMELIAKRHGLVPVPVDITASGALCLKSLRNAVSGSSRVLIVAHLFGGHTPLDDVLAVVAEHDILVVEDCAQSFRAPGHRGHPRSDVVMHSFGPIKTATALGGAVVTVRDEDLRSRMARILAADPVQRRLHYGRRILRFALLKALSGCWLSSVACWLLKCMRWDVDALVNRLGQGFARKRQLIQFRRQPSAALLRMLTRRWRTYDYGRIERRRRLGRTLDEHLGCSRDTAHSYWVYPYFTNNRAMLCQRLRAAGYDATCRSRMTVVNGDDDASDRQVPCAAQLWKQMMFLPWYPDLPDDAVAEMARIIRSFAAPQPPSDTR